MPAEETTVPTVSVVVPTAGRSASLRAVVASALDGPALECVVVDDRVGEVPGALTLPPDPRVRVVPGPRTGPGPARAAGVEAAVGEVVLLLDDDVVGAAGLVAAHAARHAGLGGVVVAGAMPVVLRGADEPRPRWPRALYAADYARRVARWAEDEDDVLLHLWTGNVSLRRDDALRVGLASPHYAGYRHEDRDLGLRLRFGGLRGVYAPEARAVHAYARGAEAFMTDARAQGAEQALLARVHPDAHGPRRARDLTRGAPAPLRLLLLTARARHGATLLRAVLRTLTAAADRAGLDALALRAAQVRRRAEQIDGWTRPDVGQ